MARERSTRARPDEVLIEGPVRTCIGCRARAARRELLRVTAGSDAHGQPVVVPDPSNTAPGRGAHLHPTTGCYDLAVRRKAFSRALRVPGGISTTAVADLLGPTADTHTTGSTTGTTLTDQDWSSSS